MIYAKFTPRGIGMATFLRRGKRWRVEVCVDGKRKSATKDTKAQAMAWSLEQERKLSAGDTGKTFGDALERYSNEVSPTKRGVKWERLRINSFIADPLGAVQMIDLNQAHIAAWRDRRLCSVSAGTVLREMVLIRHCLTLAQREWLWIDNNPASNVRKPKAPQPRTRRISQDEIDAIVSACDYLGGKPQTTAHVVALAFMFAIETAMRAGEILSIKPDSVNMKGRYVHLAITKNGTARDVPLSARAGEILDLVDCRFAITSARLDALFRKVRDAAGIEGLRFHDTRREATSRMARVLHPMELARVTGHKDLKMLMIYYQESASEIARKL
jgi:integrase